MAKIEKEVKVTEVETNETAGINMEELREEIKKEMKEELRKEMKDVVKLDVKVEVLDENKEFEKHMMEKVPFYAFKDNDKYKDDIVVVWNGKTYQIKRGLHTNIPRGVKQIIEQAEEQKTFAANTIEKFTNEFELRQKTGAL